MVQRGGIGVRKFLEKEMGPHLVHMGFAGNKVANNKSEGTMEAQKSRGKGGEMLQV